MIFKDRLDAAKQLAEKLGKYKNKKDALILAIPRGGVQTGYVLAKELGLKLDVILTKKIGYPANPEFAIGAVSLLGESIDQSLIKSGEVSELYVKNEIRDIKKLLKQRYKNYTGREKPRDLKNKIVIITDDGIATGRTIMAAIEVAKQNHAKKVVVAVPVGPPDTCKELKEQADEVICLSTPRFFFAISQFYDHFPQVEDEEAIKLLKEANK